jgi:transketolase
MRMAFVEALCTAASRDSRVWLLCGDLGYSVLEAFSTRFPKRFLNAGVAEQNMTGVAAGLALSGKIVFTYSIANFPVFRCLEQIRTDVCCHNLNVSVVSVGGGLAYGSQGYTHQAVEDLAVMSALPNMKVIAPGDPVEAKAAVHALAQGAGPAYLRLGKAGEPVLHSSPIQFEIGKAIQVQDGSDLTLISTGGMLQSVILAAKRLAAEGLSIRVVSMPTVHPIDEEAIDRAAKDTGRIITVEEHGWGGLGTQTAEVIARKGITMRFLPLRLASEPVKIAGSHEYLRERLGLGVAGICNRAIQMMGTGLACSRVSA